MKISILQRNCLLLMEWHADYYLSLMITLKEKYFYSKYALKALFAGIRRKLMWFMVLAENYIFYSKIRLGKS